jgi:spermidine synthase
VTSRLPWIGVFLGLALSGVAGLVNQVVWQRGLKLFLGGSETLSSMVVVLVFLAGLGLGAALAARASRRVRNPLGALAAVEACLAAVNLAVALLLSLDIADSVAAAQRLATSVGLPLLGVYAVGASLVLLPPTLLMGATIPLSSEASQRQLAGTDPRLIHRLIVVNTIGAVLGAYGAGAWALPVLGQWNTLLLAAGCNAAAAVLIVALCRVKRVDSAARAAAVPPRALAREEILGFVLGFLALGYEMVLFRILALSHQPTPTTFATGLAAFLLAWSAGVWLAGARAMSIAPLAILGALAIGGVAALFNHEFWGAPWPLGAALAIYAGPCVISGLLYGSLVARVAKDWGRDVGRFSAASTAGACLGVLAFTMVGHEMPVVLTLTAIGLGLIAVAASDLRARRLVWVPSLAMVAVVVTGVMTRYTEHDGTRTYWGRDGVVQILPTREVRIDGLWHTKLSDGSDHIGQVYNWLMPFASVVAHEGRPARALVVGAGAGISGVTLAGVDGLQVDGYEINHTMRRLLEDEPQGTLGSLRAPGINWIWKDARVGLALDPKTYDIILSSPLQLRQAGSSLLLSREYVRLAKSRLAPGGVFAVYSHEGFPSQAQLIQATVAEFFPYRVTWYNGTLTIASDRPITVTGESLRLALERPDRLFREASSLDQSLAGEGGLLAWYDGEAFPVEPGARVITDDQPLVEYPALADRWGR